MRKAMVLLLGAVTALLGGCASTEEHRPTGAAPVDQRSAPRTRWSQYLVVMTDKERTEFLDIEDEAAREHWLRRNGIDVRAELSQKLARGISVESARTRLNDQPDDVLRDGRTTTLFYSRYNAGARTHYWLKFENDQLVSWNSYTQEQQDRQRELLEFEQRLQRKFDGVLERGIGMHEINRQAAHAREHLNRIEQAQGERITDPNYRGVYSPPGSRDYLIAENVLNAQKRNELFQWFQGRFPDRIIIHRPFETHRYYMVHRDMRGVETVITAEFVFQDGLLQDWFVYHET